MEKTLSLLLSVLIILSSFSIITVSANEIDKDSVSSDYSGITGDCTWTFDDSKGTLTISGNGEMMDYYIDYETGDEFLAPWHEYSEKVKSVIIEDGVTSIGTSSFSNCSNLVNITISNSVTSINNYAFRICTSLTSITIPDSVTSIDNYVFFR